MSTIGIQCVASCAGCNAEVPVNALVSSLFCPSCGGVTWLSPAGVAELVKEPLGAEGALQINEGVRSEVFTQDGKFALQYQRMEPRCEHCARPLSAETLARASEGASIACEHCRAPLSARPVPAELGAALPGVSLLLGEDLEQLAAAGATSMASSEVAPAVSCSQCGGSLKVDGSSRSLACPYCQASVVIPDEAWARLHPASASRRFYAVMARSAPRAPGDASAAAADDDDELWRQFLDDLCADDSGAVYGLHRDTLFAIDLERGAPRWIQHGCGASGAKLALRPSGELLVWYREEHSAAVYRCTDGEHLGELGGKEPDDAEMHHLDFVDVHDFAADQDGTYLAIFKQRLVRFDASGKGIPVWPAPSGLFSIFARRERLRPLWVSCPERPTGDRKSDWDAVRKRLPIGADQAQRFDWTNFDLEKLGNRPLALAWNCDPSLSVGHDGCVYVVGNGDGAAKLEMVLAKLDRDGKRRYAVRLPLISHGMAPCRVHASADGTAYVLGDQDDDYRLLLRVSPDGREIKTLGEDRALGGPLQSDDQHLAVSPSGALTIAGENGRMTIFDRDGRVLSTKRITRR